jgi:hypothetical protein
MALTALDLLLAAVVTALLSTHARRVLTDRESTTPALGWGSLFERTRKRSRIALLILSRVPSMRHFLK